MSSASDVASTIVQMAMVIKMPDDHDHDLLDAALRSDLLAFFEKAFASLNPAENYCTNWHVDAIAHKLNQCAQGKLRRLVILMPPRTLKSTMVSVAFTAFVLGREPAKKIICASYNQDLANKFSNDTRSLMNEPWYHKAFPKTIISPSKDTQSHFETTQHGMRFATSVGGALTGVGSDIIIIDDPIKASDSNSELARKAANDWFDQTVSTRLDDPSNGVIIVVMQRLHVDDLAGHVLEQNGWEVLKIPAIADEVLEHEVEPNRRIIRKPGDLLDPRRLGKKTLDGLSSTMGTSAFSAQYQQAPIPPAGNLFDWGWFQIYQTHPEFSELFMSVDVAATHAGGNYSAITIWGHRDCKYYFVAAHRFRFELPIVRKKIIEFDGQYRPDVIIVDGIGIGRGLVQELRAGSMSHVFSTRSKGKESDAHEVAPLIEGGRIFVPVSCFGLEDFRNEVIAFPNGKHDDQVDSMVQFLKNRRDCVRQAQGFKRPERKGIESLGSHLNITLTKIYAPY
jgi:predicted phage terminase large subunit-like protein